ncbi:MAG: hypothetical protein ABH868_01745 [bacterium]
MISLTGRNSEKGQMMVLSIVLMSVLLVVGAALVFISAHDKKQLVRSSQKTKAFYVADAGVEYAVYRLLSSANTFTVVSTVLPAAEGTFDVTVGTTAIANRYQISSTGYYPDSFSTKASSSISAKVVRDPAAPVFDYAYFINNWGWYWGRDITSNGDVRSNGRFDFRQGPRVNGHIYAGLEIEDGGTPIRGTGGQADHQHEYQDKVEMPNLQDLSYYQTKAIGEGGSIVINGVTLIDAVYGDDEGETGNIVLIGTSSDPIELSGTVVITGDLVIKGKISGQGTIYAGRNVYVADNIDYKNAPSSPRPASENPVVADAWVQAHKNDDLLCIAAKENIIMGNYTDTSGSEQWYAQYWLFGMGSEDVGQDGIPDTGDIGEGDGVFVPLYEDVDGDGVFDDNYNWSDIETQTAITDFTNVPVGVNNFGDLSSLTINKIEGVYYTNHAFTGRTGNAMKFNGSIVSKDEAIIYRNNITFNYDERTHSRYNADPNRFVDLGLPSVERVEVVEWSEVD